MTQKNGFYLFVCLLSGERVHIFQVYYTKGEKNEP